MKEKRNIIVSFFESVYGVIDPEKKEQAQKSHQAYRSFRAKFQSQRRPIETAADNITAFFGSISFAVLHIFWFTAWILINTGKISGLEPFDPYPFGLLTMIVSLEAIFLSVFVLVSQNRSEQVSDLRQEIDFQINTQAEQEITKLIYMIHDIHQHLGLSHKNDKELKQMMKKIDPEELATLIQDEEKKAR